ncbi:UDP-N-acetylmuramoyl-L-alanyl-D-glutamate--2,6-diaminopimelate ligase [Myxococcota bacterium]|nr:UDP-N-acetylmuramoyl-L-alanyl-D-glutamate--2,6-diaminopimelate ligase [Myxococcota bacterium]
MNRIVLGHEHLHLLRARAASPGAVGTVIEAVVADSRQVRPGSVFVALRGSRVDGHDFLDSASGASLAVVQDGRRPSRGEWIEVEDTREALGLLASWIAGEPSRAFPLAGVTGTDGKTSTVWAICAGYEACGLPAGLIGTIEYRYGGTRIPAPLTTPDALELQRLFWEMVRAGVRAAAMEVSSHALDQRRVSGTMFDVAVLTCLTRDHLDYHGTPEAYRAAKERLFTEVLPRNPQARGAVVNGDDAFGRHLVSACPLPTRTFSLVPGGGDLFPEEARFDLRGFRARVRTPWGTHLLESPLLGRHNLANLMAAIGVAGLLELDLTRFIEGLCRLSRIPGRLERVPGPAGSPLVVVDYAHTPKALEGVIAAVRDLEPGRHLTVVMGAGGDRDRGKRPLMGRACVVGADRVVVTSDNPRTEDPLAIIEAILGGIEEARREGVARAEVSVEPDRREAIFQAIRKAPPDGIVIVAGKGHEDTQTLGTRKVHFSDVETATEALQG